MKIITLILLFFTTQLFAQEEGKGLYMRKCAMCHHHKRIGHKGPPLIPEFLKKYSVEELAEKIRNGFPQTQMPTFEKLDTASLLALAAYIKSPIDEGFSWNTKKISKSITIFDDPVKDLGIKDIRQVLPVVERDGGFVWIMEGEEILDKFPLSNIHGGIKYQFPDLENIYVPTRDGWIEKYSLKEGRRLAKVRVGINLRNVSLSRDGKYVLATSLLPQQLVILDSKDLKPVKTINLGGKASAIYELYTKDKAIFTYRDQPKIGVLDLNTLQVTYTDIAEPIEDFFIDPFDKYIIATARRGKVLRVFDIETFKVVFEHDMVGMPHLFSATYWYQDGSFYFATPHLRKSYVTVWKMYDWSFERQVEIGGDGFFVKTHPNTPFLWIDNGTDELVLVDKNTFKVKKIIPVAGKQYIHAEFSGNGKYTYLSIYENNGSIEVLDTKTLKILKSYPANMPIGKYNFVNKNRRYLPGLFGMDITNEKCKGAEDENKCLLSLKGLNKLEKVAIDNYLKNLKTP